MSLFLKKIGIGLILKKNEQKKKGNIFQSQNILWLVLGRKLDFEFALNDGVYCGRCILSLQILHASPWSTTP